jgi:nucleoside 2-deoxyribosyltransferase
MRVYLAGPDVFLPDAAKRAEAKKALLVAAGHTPLFPLDAVLDVEFENDPKPLIAEAIFASNTAMIEAADAILANLTPFRGPSADAGTVWEIGYARGLGKPVFGYSNVGASFAARVRAHLVAAPDGLDIEDFDLPSDNLMIHFGLAGYFAHDAPGEARWRDLTSFELAVAALP